MCISNKCIIFEWVAETQQYCLMTILVVILECLKCLQYEDFELL